MSEKVDFQQLERFAEAMKEAIEDKTTWGKNELSHVIDRVHIQVLKEAFRHARQ